jgi:hypothetical protein
VGHCGNGLRSDMGILGGRREYRSCFLSRFPLSDDVGVVHMRFACEAIAISWKHSSTNCAAAILNTGLTPKNPLPTWNGSKLSTRRFVAHLFLRFNRFPHHIRRAGLGYLWHWLTDVLFLLADWAGFSPSIDCRGPANNQDIGLAKDRFDKCVLLSL